MQKKEFQNLMQEKLEYLITDDETALDIKALAAFCYGYEFTDEILEFIEEHPEATRKELWQYFDESVPDGFAPGDDGSEWILEEAEKKDDNSD